MCGSTTRSRSDASRRGFLPWPWPCWRASSGGWFESAIATFPIVYAFAVPVGATLSRPLLARRPKGELWGLTAWAAVCVLGGLMSA